MMGIPFTQHINQVSDTETRDVLFAVLGAVKAELEAIHGDSIINATTLSTGSTTANVATTAFQYRIDGVTYAKAAVTAGTALGITDTINTGTATGSFWGGFAAQINAAGTISFKAAATDQVETTEGAARVEAMDIAADAGNLIIGLFTVQANADSAWVAGTDDLTAASDCQAVNYYSVASSLTLTD